VTTSADWQAKIWEQYRSNLQALLRAKVSNAADAEDLLQEIMLKTHNKLGSLRDQSNLKAWLMQIARNSITDFYRAKGKLRSLEDELAHEHWQIDDDLPSAQQDLSQCVRPFIQALPTDKASLLIAIDLEGQSQKALAAEMGISYSGLKSRVQRARLDLRQLFESCCHLDLDVQGQVMGYDQPNKCC
jgi:RNA polymerase sigma-70 factor, ECF subfamily